MNERLKSFSHPALISTPPTTWTGEAWTQQVRNALVWLKLGITTSETLPLSLVARLLGRKRSPRRHSIWTACSVTRGQLSLTTQVAVTGDPRGTTELDARTFAHGSMSSSNNDKMWRVEKNLDCKCPDFYKLYCRKGLIFSLCIISNTKKGNMLSQLSS